MNKTPLYESHKSYSAKLVDFAGWAMPLQYSGVIDEYHAVRGQAGLFDVSHMGRLQFTGEGALDFLQWVTTNDVSKLSVGQAQYSMICNPEGGVKMTMSLCIVRVWMSIWSVCECLEPRENWPMVIRAES